MLRTENITKFYGDYRAINDISIDVEPQSIFGLLGPNGAGKTTLIRIINQITAPDEGKVFLEDRPIAAADKESIGYLPEERGLYKKMKVGEQVIYLARLKGMTKSDAEKELKAWMDKFNISDWWNRKIEDLSKGMQQKIQFIATVIHKPKLLILDEPFSGFDPINTNLVKQEILKLKDEGSTIIFSTHNMNSVEEICDKIALINQSEKILEGTVNDLQSQYKENTYRIDFKGNMISLTAALWAGYELVDQKIEGQNCSAVIKCLEGQSINNFLTPLLSAIEIKRVEEILPSMNDIFIKAVSKEDE